VEFLAAVTLVHRPLSAQIGELDERTPITARLEDPDPKLVTPTFERTPNSPGMIRQGTARFRFDLATTNLGLPAGIELAAADGPRSCVLSASLRLELSSTAL
jgi:hypothetical protein